MVLGIDSLIRIGRRIYNYKHTIGNRSSARVSDDDRSKRCHSPARQLPRLMLRSTSRKLNNTHRKDHCFLSLSDEKIYKLSSPSCNNDFVGSIEGWLIVVDHEFVQPADGFRSFQSLNNESRSSFGAIYFLNPTSHERVRVMLPSQFNSPCGKGNQQSFKFKKIVASSAPTSPHCVVAGLCSQDFDDQKKEKRLCSQGRLAICRPTDMSWTLIEDWDVRGLDFCDIEIIDGKLYAATREASEFIMVFDIEDAMKNVGRPNFGVENLVMRKPGPIPLQITTRDDGEIRDDVYLAKDAASKELFMIFRGNSFIREKDSIICWSDIKGCDNFVIPPETFGFQVFRLECAGNGHEWVKVSDLGDRILFVSKASNILLSATNVAWEKTLDRNCICFAFDNFCSSSPSRGRDIGVFSLTNKSIMNFNCLKDLRGELDAPPIWFTSNN